MTAATTMYRLYRVRWYQAHSYARTQPVLVSASNKPEAKRRAKEFIASNYGGSVCVELVEYICKTPDDVLDWV